MTTAGVIRPGTAEDVIRKARAVLEKGWTRHAGALNQSGDLVAPHSPDACCWCLGAAIMLSSSGTPEARDAALALVARYIVEQHPGLQWSRALTGSDAPTPADIVITYNDAQREVDDVLALLDRILEAVPS